MMNLKTMRWLLVIIFCLSGNISAEAANQTTQAAPAASAQPQTGSNQDLQQQILALRQQVDELSAKVAQDQTSSQTAAVKAGEVQQTLSLMPKLNFAFQLRNSFNQTQNPAKYTGGPDVTDYNATNAFWLQVQISGNIAGNWKYFSEIRTQDIPEFNFGGNGNPPTTYIGNSIPGFNLRAAYVYGDALNGTLYAGRFPDTLPFTCGTGVQGLIADSRLNGLRLSWKGSEFSGDVFAGGDSSNFPGYASQSYPDANMNSIFTGADFGYAAGYANFYAGAYAAMPFNGSNINQAKPSPFGGWVGAPTWFFEGGADHNFTDKLRLSGFIGGSPNMAPDDISVAPLVDQMAYMLRLDYGKPDRNLHGNIRYYIVLAQAGAYGVWGNDNANAASYDIEYYWPNRQQGARGAEIGMDWTAFASNIWHFSASCTTPLNDFVPTLEGQLGGNQPYYVFKSECTFYF